MLKTDKNINPFVVLFPLFLPLSGWKTDCAGQGVKENKRKRKEKQNPKVLFFLLSFLRKQVQKISSKIQFFT